VTTESARAIRHFTRTDSCEVLKRPYGSVQVIIARDAMFAALQCVRVRLDPGCATCPHYHPNEELFVVTSGEVEVGDGPDKPLVVAQIGDVVTVPANVPHYLRNISTTEVATVVAALAPFRIPEAVVYSQSTE
jgi:quercetin dioxygenase-like cupin family protein